MSGIYFHLQSSDGGSGSGSANKKARTSSANQSADVSMTSDGSALDKKYAADQIVRYLTPYYKEGKFASKVRLLPSY